MRKVILLEHISLDGFLAGPKGEMDWIRADDEMWQHYDPINAAADTAIYGRVTYQMMARYWPTAADRPGATQHDIDHARWVNTATRLVFSETLEVAPWGSDSAQLMKGDIAGQMTALKQQPGKDMLLIGSAGLAREFIRLGLVDEYWLNLNPVILGSGKPLFPDTVSRLSLELIDTRTFPSGVVALHYRAAS